MHKTHWLDTSLHLPDITAPSAWHRSLRNGCPFCWLLLHLSSTAPLLGSVLSTMCQYIHQAPSPLAGYLGISLCVPAAHQISSAIPSVSLHCWSSSRRMLEESFSPFVDIAINQTARQECMCLDDSHFLRKRLFKFFTFTLLCFHNPDKWGLGQRCTWNCRPLPTGSWGSTTDLAYKAFLQFEKHLRASR